MDGSERVTRRLRVLGGWMMAAAGLVASGCAPRAEVLAPEPNMDRAMELRASMGGSPEEGAVDGAAAATQQPTGFATLRGRFVLDGTTPARPRLVVDKDIEVCAPGGRVVYSQSLVVDEATSGIKDVLIYADRVPEEWCHETMRPGARTEQFVFDQKECLFLTHVSALQVSQPLRVLNSDPVGHNTNMKPARNPTMNLLIPPEGVVYQPKAEEAQPFEANCSIHPWMSAWLIFRSNGYFAVSAEDGSFEIPMLPAGVPIELKVWQERVKFLGKVKLDEGSGPSEVTWRRGTYEVTLDPDEQREIVVTISADVFGS